MLEEGPRSGQYLLVVNKISIYSYQLLGDTKVEKSIMSIGEWHTKKKKIGCVYFKIEH